MKRIQILFLLCLALSFTFSIFAQDKDTKEVIILQTSDVQDITGIISEFFSYSIFLDSPFYFMVIRPSSLEVIAFRLRRYFSGNTLL